MALNSEERDLIRAEVASALNRQNVDLAQQVERHRNFLQSQQRWLVTGITSIVFVLAVAGVWFFGDTLPKQIDDRVIRYRIVEQLEPEFLERIELLIDELVKARKADLNSQLDDLTENAKARLTRIVDDKILTAENRLQSQSDELVELAIQELGEQNSQQLDATANAVSHLLSGQVRELVLDIVNVPVGSILAWHKDLFGVPKLPAGWVRSDGQRIEDEKSPLYGQILPNLNSQGLFLRGNVVSGEVQEQDWKSLSVVSHRVKYTHGPVTIPKNGSDSDHVFAGEWNSVLEHGANVANGLQFAFDASEVRPRNFSVVWIVRIF